ncbi:Uncharacterised protein [Streptococcus pneumoniae]|nr:Uncharacterised protein [Streptococcus pneumoniae]
MEPYHVRKHLIQCKLLLQVLDYRVSLGLRERKHQ